MGERLVSLKLAWFLWAFPYFFPGECMSIEEKYISATEVFSVRLSPHLFNFTFGNSVNHYGDDSYNYHASLVGHPDLPSWCNLDKSRNGAFLYGVSPDPAPELEVIAVNTRTYESSSLILRLIILPKTESAKYEVQLKINNFDIGEFLERESISRLMTIFRVELWPEATKDLHVTYLASALQHGARRPLRASDGEGVYITLGSVSPFSTVLTELQREVGPLWTSRPCPRDFKKTSLEKNFRNRGFIVDWCNFRLVEREAIASTYSSMEVGDNYDTADEYIMHSDLPVEEKKLWIAPAKHEIPRRSYTVDGLVSVFVPIVAAILMICGISFVLAVYQQGEDINEGELYESFFDEFHFERKTFTVPEKEHLSPTDSEEEEPFQNQDSDCGLSPQSSHNLSLPLGADNSSYSRDSTPYRMSAVDTSYDGTKQGSSPFSTLSKNGTRATSMTPYGSLSRTLARQVEARASTINRPEPPPYGTTRAANV